MNCRIRDVRAQFMNVRVHAISDVRVRAFIDVRAQYTYVRVQIDKKKANCELSHLKFFADARPNSHILTSLNLSSQLSHLLKKGSDIQM